MVQRGRKPAASAVVVAGRFGERPQPPAELTPRQAEIWREVVASEDAGFFRTGALRGLLAVYCQRRDASEGISAVINTFNPQWLTTGEGIKRYKRLLSMRDLECRGASSLATKLRLTNQSRYMPRAAASAARNAPIGPLPWQWPRSDEPA